jgi:hypothetical protein
MRKYSKEQWSERDIEKKKKQLTLEPLLLLVRPAAPRGKRRATNFFFLEDGGVEAADGGSSSGEEEEALAFFWPFGGREATLFLLGFFLERLALTLLVLEGATMDSVGFSTGAVVDFFSDADAEVADLPFFPAFIFLGGVFLGEEAGFLSAFSTVWSTGASLLLPLPRLEGIIRRSSTTLTELL